jgi:hypothetical protein
MRHKKLSKVKEIKKISRVALPKVPPVKCFGDTKYTRKIKHKKQNLELNN